MTIHRPMISLVGFCIVPALILCGCLRVAYDRSSARNEWRPPAQSSGSRSMAVRPPVGEVEAHAVEDSARDHNPVGANTEESVVFERLSWPVRGDVLSQFGEGDGIEKRGIEIGVRAGAHVGAAAYGKVAYVGEIRGVGWVVIIEHARRLVTVYGGFDRVIVQKGMMVRRNQILGGLRTSPNLKGSSLHFEVRLRSKPVDPLQFLERLA